MFRPHDYLLVSTLFPGKVEIGRAIYSSVVRFMSKRSLVSPAVGPATGDLSAEDNWSYTAEKPSSSMPEPACFGERELHASRALAYGRGRESSIPERPGVGGPHLCSL